MFLPPENRRLMGEPSSGRASHRDVHPRRGPLKEPRKTGPHLRRGLQGRLEVRREPQRESHREVLGLKRERQCVVERIVAPGWRYAPHQWASFSIRTPPGPNTKPAIAANSSACAIEDASEIPATPYRFINT